LGACKGCPSVTGLRWAGRMRQPTWKETDRSERGVIVPAMDESASRTADSTRCSLEEGGGARSPDTARAVCCSRLKQWLPLESTCPHHHRTHLGQTRHTPHTQQTRSALSQSRSLALTLSCSHSLFPSFPLPLFPSFPLSLFPSFPLSLFPSFPLSLFPSFPLSLSGPVDAWNQGPEGAIVDLVRNPEMRHRHTSR